MKRNNKSIVFSMNAKLNFKLIVIGNRSAGKTSLVLRFVKETFQTNYKVTLGVEFYSKILVDNNQQIAFQIWDTAGSQNYKCIVKSFYQHAHCALILYEKYEDLFNSTELWIAEVKQQINQLSKIFLVRTKVDLYKVESEQQQKVKQVMKKNGLEHFFKISAKDNLNVKELFDKIASVLHQSYKKDETFRDFIHRRQESFVLSTQSFVQSPRKRFRPRCCQN